MAATHGGEGCGEGGEEFPLLAVAVVGAVLYNTCCTEQLVHRCTPAHLTHSPTRAYSLFSSNRHCDRGLANSRPPSHNSVHNNGSGLDVYKQHPA